jgi:dTMP kinase
MDDRGHTKGSALEEALSLCTAANMKGLLITFEGTEGGGKTTQIKLLADKLRSSGRTVRTLREPGGTAIGEEIRHTLQHSLDNQAMTPETELLLINASRAQLVREVIRPALSAGEIVLCDRFYDSTVAYQCYGRGLDPVMTEMVIRLAVGETHPDMTLLLTVPIQISEARRHKRQESGSVIRDRMEEAGREFFMRVEQGYLAILKSSPARVREINAIGSIETVADAVWNEIEPLLS